MAVGNNNNGGSKVFYNVAAGKIVQPAEEGQVNAKMRTYTKEENGVKTEHTKWEFQHDFICGKITAAYIWSGKFGDVLKIEIDNEEVLNIPLASRYFYPTAEKLKSLDFDKQVVFTPFDFTPKGKDKKITGMSLKQDEKKVESFYYDFDKKEAKNGMPKPKDSSKMNSDKWKMYFLEKDIFLKEEIEGLIFSQNPTSVNIDSEEIIEPEF